GRQRPRPDAEGRAANLCLAELVVDDELLEGAGVAPPRLRPLRREVAGVGDAAPLLDGVEALHLSYKRADLFAQGLGFGRQVDGETPASAAACGVSGAHTPHRDRTEGLTSRCGPLQVQVPARRPRQAGPREDLAPTAGADVGAV